MKRTSGSGIGGDLVRWCDDCYSSLNCVGLIDENDQMVVLDIAIILFKAAKLMLGWIGHSSRIMYLQNYDRLVTLLECICWFEQMAINQKR